ncbi:MAG: aspartate carbamoyltransferase [Candidatus Pacebacteria bacterium]|nr:aspartate carbamoyltransferase [Candidatus Paceibacterota bacterium]
MRNLISTNDLTKETVEKLLARSKKMEAQCKKGKVKKLLNGKIIASIFFEPSTRTRLSFETAALRLGAQVITAEDAGGNSSAQKGETIEDTARILSSYADAIVIRHKEPGSLARAALTSNKPLINAGDGEHEHPSQGLLDLYTIQKEHGKLEDLTIAFVGDLKNSRTLHSLLPLLLMYKGNTFYFVSPKEQSIPESYKGLLKEKNVTYFETENLEDVLPKADVLYMTRVQKERFKDEAEYMKIKDRFLLNLGHTDFMKQNAIIMHPLPRVNELDSAIDNDYRAAYFRQAENGLYVRMAIFLYVFGIK